MNKQLALEYRMDTGMDSMRYDLHAQFLQEVDVATDEYVEWLEEKFLSKKTEIVTEIKTIEIKQDLWDALTEFYKEWKDDIFGQVHVDDKLNKEQVKSLLNIGKTLCG